jgi:hypothetical protein
MSDLELSPEEIRQVRRYLEVQKIRKKKEVLYSHLMDGRDPDAWSELFTENATGDWGKFGNPRGREEIRLKLQYKLDQPEYYGFHMTTNYWIELTGDDTATGRSYLQDISMALKPNVHPVVEYGIYEEDWVKIDGDWKIKHHRCFFLWPIRQPGTEDEFAVKLEPTVLA